MTVNRFREEPAMAKLQAVNTTRNAVLAEDVELAKTIWTRFKGLMFRPELPEGKGLWIEPCADIHSCCMRFAFDAVFVNGDGEVLHTVEAMKPWRISRFVRGGRAVLELPAGVIQRTGTAVGDTVRLEPDS